VTSRRDERNEAVRAERRAEIIECALALFSQHGYAQTTVRMIADAAGMSQGLLYRYFENKQQLLQAIFESSIADVRQSFAAADAGGTPTEKLERLIRSAFQIVRERRRFWQLSYGVRMQQAVLAGLGEGVRQWTSEIGYVLEAYLRDAGYAAPGVEAAILFALIDGVCQHYVLDPDNYPLDAVAEAIVERYRSSPDV
jgi:AcrR family transcriptional regulator